MTIRHVTQIILNDRTLFIGSVVIVLSILAGGIMNYFTFSSGGGVEFFMPLVMLWAYLYTPLILFKKVGNWKVSEFGFVVNRAVGFSVAVSVIIGIWIFFTSPEMRVFAQWSDSLLTAFARVGEELFFRGFIYLFLLKVFKMKPKPHLWAIIGSSVAFAAVHTQCFLPGTQMSITVIFALALVMAYLRHLTGSILPAITIHCYLNSNLLGVLFGWAIYLVIVMVGKANGRVTEERTIGQQ